MDETLLLPLKQIASMALLALVGYVLGKRKILPNDSPKVLSQVLVNAFMPALIINNLSSNVTIEAITTKGALLILSISLLVISILLSRLGALAMTPDLALMPMVSYYLAFPNFAYIGYPIVTALFGSAVLSDYILFSMPFSICVYTYGRQLITGKRVNAAHAILSPTVLAIIIGLSLGFLQIQLPSFISQALTGAAVCVNPISMLLIGVVLAKSDIRMMINRLAFSITLLRLVVIPAAIAGLAALLGLRGIMLAILVLFLGMPLPLNAVIFQEADKKDSQSIASVCCLSYLFALITLPITLMIVMRLFT